MKNAEVATHNGTQWKNTEVDYTQAYHYFALDYMDCYWKSKVKSILLFEVLKV